MKVRKNSLSDYLLIGMEKAVDGLILLEDMTYHSYKYSGGMVPGPKKSAIAKAIVRLREAGYVEKEISDERRIILRLTTIGREYLGMTTSAWDGKVRIVIWDIPESKRRVRDLLRRRLKEWGFKAWQRSVWVSKKNVTTQLKNLINELGIEKWVAVIESDDPSITSMFNVSLR